MARRGSNAKFYEMQARQAAEKKARQVASTAQLTAEPPAEPKLPYIHMFWLVQRMEYLADYPILFNKGIDKWFDLDYMGAAEFEWGAIPKSLRRIRESGDVVIQAAAMQWRDVERTVYFVGSQSAMEHKLDNFQRWLHKGMQSKEYTQFHQQFTGDPGLMPEKYLRTNAWWSLGHSDDRMPPTDDIMWTLDEQIAVKLLECIIHPEEV